MEFRTLSDSYTTSPQIAPEDMPALQVAGYAMVIANRPDAENPPEWSHEAMAEAAKAAGLAFVYNPVIGGALTLENVAAQDAAMAAATGPVFAYCASGNRSSVVWALANAGRMPAEEMVEAAARHGYQLAHLVPQLEALAASKAEKG